MLHYKQFRQRLNFRVARTNLYFAINFQNFYPLQLSLEKFKRGLNTILKDTVLKNVFASIIIKVQKRF